MPKKPKHKPDDTQQSSRFIDTAKALGVDQSGNVFERALELVIPPMPVVEKPATEKKSGPS
jgi:hypothetical protein